jgi:WD40 repeat protein
MAMERDYIVIETHPKPITAISANPSKREIFLGFEDGVIKSIDVDTGRDLQTYNEHKGWVTSFLIWAPQKILFSSSNDAVIVAIGSSNTVVDKIYIGTPVYCMALNYRRQEIVLGIPNGLQFHRLHESKNAFNHYIDTKPSSIVTEHVDIVRCVITSDSRIFSGGFDGTLVIYDCPYTSVESAVKCFKNKYAHDAGISCLLVEKDSIENNTWIVTGSFDKTVKVWTSDGKIIYRFDGFVTSVTGICYVPKLKTIWCVAGTNAAYIYDPKSGENVTDYMETFANQFDDNYYLHMIKYLNEFGLMVATTNRKQLVVYKYNPYGCLASIKHKKGIDSICYTKKAPILMFTGWTFFCFTKTTDTTKSRVP